MRIIFFLVILFLLGFLIIVGTRILYNLLLNFRPNRSRVMADLRKMKSDLRLFINELVPWSQEELELLSLNQVNKKVQKGVVPTARGIITSIYHEPLIAWSYKRYFGKEEDALIYACTSDREFVYRIRKGETAFMIDGKEIGVLRENGVLYSAQNQRMMARINRSPSAQSLPILVGDREIANLISPQHETKVNPRAFELLSETNREEETILLSLAILEIMQPHLPKT